MCRSILLTGQFLISSTTSLVKISEINDVIYYDLSDEEFTISPSVTITSPTENQNLGSSSSIDII